MIETEETLSGSVSGTGSLTSSIKSNNTLSGKVDNGVVVIDETDPTVPEHVKAITEENISNWNNKSEFSGDYNDLTNSPLIPTKTSQLENDNGYLNKIPSEYVTDEELASKGYLTEHQDISNLATKKELSDGLNGKANSNHTHSQYLTSIPSEYVTETELNNKKYLTSIPSEYVTETELNNKKYLTSIPSEYVTESELNAKDYATKKDLEDIDVDLTDYYTKTEIDDKGYLTQEDIKDIDVDINSISEETIKEIVNIQIVNANEVSY